MSGPLLVEVTRAGLVESLHEVDAVVVDTSGRIVEAWGDASRPVMPRSAIKPIQALPLLSTGAADAFHLTDVELALACASHGGEPAHVDAVAGWLARLGLDAADLACGAQVPMNASAAAAVAAAGTDATAAYNNCSGKHAGFLTILRHLGLPLDGYVDPTHPLQADHITPSIERTCGVDLAAAHPGVDGCGIPVWSMPLDRLARGWATIGGEPEGSPAQRLLSAMRNEPFLVAGSSRACTRLIRTATGGTVVKTGAEGVFCAVLPADGYGLALKVRDGAGRAAEAAVEWILARCGRLPDPVPSPLVNHAGLQVGEVRVAG
jgi:L-asparaginase II